MPAAPHPTRAKAAPLPDTDLNPRRDTPLDFPDLAFGEMTPADYRELGFLCGLEVHQQLATRGKLFCRCPAGRRQQHVDAEVLRHMRPTLSEMGEYDGCALMEFKTRKEIVYLLERATTCTYEMDDTPPFPIDEEAVKVALEVSRLFQLQLVSELHVMRKQYLDGSIPTGFQRTAMVGLGGVIPFRDSELGARELRIRQLSLEEDSCREIADVGHRIWFRTDRLGVPLIETVTEPDLWTPLDAQRGGRLLAAVARASGKVRRGAGAARQDVNVSIAGSRRVEIKGVDNHNVLPRLVHVEAFRHLNLLRLREALRTRELSPDSLALPDRGLPWHVSALAIDASALLAHARHPALAAAIARGQTAVAMVLPGFGGLLSHPTQPGRTFAHELAERVRVIACPEPSPFLLVEELHPDALGRARWQQVRAALRASGGDAVLVLWASERDVATAVREVLDRAAEAFVGVPSETRQAHPDGSTGFERILPGPQRMYPDTDTPPLPVPDAWLQSIETTLPALPWELEDRYVERGVPVAAARRLAVAPWRTLFEALAPQQPETAKRVAFALEKRLPALLRCGAPLPDAARLSGWVRALDDGTLDPAAAEFVLLDLLREPQREPNEVLAAHTIAADADAAIAAAVGALPASPVDPGNGAQWRWALGTVQAGRSRGVLPLADLRQRLATRLGAREATS